MIDGRTELYGFFAHPAKHSLSPAIYNQAFNTLGLNQVYLAFDTPNSPTDVIQSIKTLNLQGGNFSMPFKSSVVPFFDELTPRAKRIGTVNTFSYHHHRLIGENTDGLGLRDSLAAINKPLSQFNKVGILGGGGAAKSLIEMCLAEDVPEIFVYKRFNSTFTQLQTWCETIRLLFPATQSKLQILAMNSELANQSFLDLDILINATPVGMGIHAQQMPITESELSQLKPEALIYDLIYANRQTPLLHKAKQLGFQTINGLPLLIYQAAAAFHFWTGLKMPVAQIISSINQKEGLL